MAQGFWKGVLPSIVIVSNPSVNYMLYEYLRARLEDWRRVLSVDDGKFRRTSPAGAVVISPWIAQNTAALENMRHEWTSQRSALLRLSQWVEVSGAAGIGVSLRGESYRVCYEAQPKLLPSGSPCESALSCSGPGIN